LTWQRHGSDLLPPPSAATPPHPPPAPPIAPRAHAHPHTLYPTLPPSLRTGFSIYGLQDTGLGLWTDIRTLTYDAAADGWRTTLVGPSLPFRAVVLYRRFCNPPPWAPHCTAHCAPGLPFRVPWRTGFAARVTPHSAPHLVSIFFPIFVAVPFATPPVVA